MIDKFTVPLRLMRHINWDRLMQVEVMNAAPIKVTITEVREGHAEELVGYEFKIIR
jgi:hypothetical protein